MNMTPRSNSELDLTDGRQQGDWKSRYPPLVWLQIVIETLYLICTLIITSASIIYVGHLVSTADSDVIRLGILGWESTTILLKWIAIALAGCVGGTTYDLKWLYHSVARNTWNRDRVLWRFFVPPISGAVSVFFSFLLQAGLINLAGAKPIGWYAALGLGFLFGYFSDNVIAYLYNWSIRLFGTTEQRDQ